MITEYNWYELQTISRVPENQILLMFALYIGIGNKMSNNWELLRYKLYLEKIPRELKTKRFILRTDNGVFSNYKCNDPQNYVKNLSFIHSKVSVETKLEYLYILSQRSLDNPNNWIKQDYVEPEYWTNIFTYRKEGKIFFPLEQQNHTKIGEKNK
jgi:hypothetical protein